MQVDDAHLRAQRLLRADAEPVRVRVRRAFAVGLPRATTAPHTPAPAPAPSSQAHGLAWGHVRAAPAHVDARARMHRALVVEHERAAALREHTLDAALGHRVVADAQPAAARARGRLRAVLPVVPRLPEYRRARVVRLRRLLWRGTPVGLCAGACSGGGGLGICILGLIGLEAQWVDERGRDPLAVQSLGLPPVANIMPERVLPIVAHHRGQPVYCALRAWGIRLWRGRRRPPRVA